KAAYLIKNNAPDEEIAQALQNVLQVEPDDRMAMSMLIQYYASGNDYRAIENLCRQAVNYYPDNLTYHFYLGLSLYQQSRKTEAIDAFNQGVRIKGDNVNPDEVSEMFSILGDLYYEQGRAEDAFAAYDSSLVYKEDNLSCLNNYAYYLSLRNERLDQAEEMSYRTVKKEPANRTYLDTYAWILFKKGDYNGARIYIDRVVSPESDEDELMNNKDLQGNVIEHAGDIYFMTGDRQTAVWLWNIALMKADDTTTERLPKKIRKKKYIK
ncbi:MAG: tetratricopeptide repeat protein, partial [Bacteroidaceae bacterium]|nr:tetratricopeptide repeat protein [Bacteroidaceae bacterium]